MQRQGVVQQTLLLTVGKSSREDSRKEVSVIIKAGAFAHEVRVPRQQGSLGMLSEEIQLQGIGPKGPARKRSFHGRKRRRRIVGEKNRSKKGDSPSGPGMEKRSHCFGR